MIGFVSLFILLLNRNSVAQLSHHRTSDVKTMCYIVLISHSLHWRYIKTAFQEYVIKKNRTYVDQSLIAISACLFSIGFFFGETVEIFLFSNLFKGLIHLLSLK